MIMMTSDYLINAIEQLAYVRAQQLFYSQIGQHEKALGSQKEYHNLLKMFQNAYQTVKPWMSVDPWSIQKSTNEALDKSAMIEGSGYWAQINNIYYTKDWKVNTIGDYGKPADEVNFPSQLYQQLKEERAETEEAILVPESYWDSFEEERKV